MNTLYVARDSLVHRLDPRTKMLMGIAVLVTAFICNDVSHMVFLLVLLMPLVLMSGTVRQFHGPVLFMCTITIFILVFQGIYYPGASTPVLRLWGNTAFREEGLLYACSIAMRIIVIGTAFTLVVLTTHPSDLAAGLLKWHVPYSVAFMILSTFQIIPILTREGSIIIEAQQSRCLDVRSSFTKKVKNLIPLFAPLFIITFIRVLQLSQVLECRAFSSPIPKTSLRECRMRTTDWCFTGLFVAAPFVFVWIRLFAPRFTGPDLLLGIVFTVGAVLLLLVIRMIASAAARKIAAARMNPQTKEAGAR